MGSEQPTTQPGEQPVVGLDLAAARAELEKLGYAVRNIERLTAGASNETYRVTVDGDLLVLRWSPGGLPDNEAIGLAAEAALLRAAAAAGVAVPAVVAEFGADSPAGPALVLEWLNGETLGARIVRSASFAEARDQLAFQCGQQLARIHSVDPGELNDVGLASLDPEQLVTQTWQNYQDLGTPQPMIDFTARWLLDHLPATESRSLVHGDFRNGNLMVDPTDGLVGVLDWELAHIGDPMRDVGWMLCRSWRFGRPDLAVGGFGDVDDLVAGYESVNGVQVDREVVRFWEVFGSFWWSITCLGMVDIYRQGVDRSFERLAIGRRSSEGQADCVAMLIPGSTPAPLVASDPPPGTAEAPSIFELLDGVAGFVRSLPDQVDARTGFLAKVAANSIMIAARDADLGPSARAAETTRLGELLGITAPLGELRRELCQQLRADTIDSSEPALAAHLRATVADQLAIDQPTYPAFSTEQ